MSDRRYIALALFCAGFGLIATSFLSDGVVQRVTHFVDDATGLGQLMSAIVIVITSLALGIIGAFLFLRR